jgi:hypothetical protein
MRHEERLAWPTFPEEETKSRRPSAAHSDTLLAQPGPASNFILGCMRHRTTTLGHGERSICIATAEVMKMDLVSDNAAEGTQLEISLKMGKDEPGRYMLLT